MITTKILKGTATAVATLGILGWVLTSEWKVVRAYALIGATYPGSTVSYKINPSFIDPSAGSATQQITALQAAANAWQSQAGLDFGFSYGGQTSIATVAYDGTNTVYYSNTDGGGALAVCYYWMGGGQMYQFDIQFFDRDGTYNFVWATTPTIAQFDIQSVATHEFGHALGLGHSAINGATMYPSIAPGDMSCRSLHSDDIAGAQALYGVAAPSVTSCSPASVFVDGGGTLTITGQGFSSSNLIVRLAGQTVPSPTFVSPTQVTCTIPAAPALGLVSVEVCSNGQCGSANVFTYDTVRVLDPVVPVGGVAQIEFRAPTFASHVFQGLAAAGATGIPLAQYADPLDTRVLPISLDGLLEWQLQTQPDNWFQNFYNQLNGQGSAFGFFYVPDDNAASGHTVHFTWFVWDQSAQSGVGHVGNHVTLMIQ